MLKQSFFQCDASELAIKLLGKVIWRRVQSVWLAAQIIETECYYLDDKASHASLGFTTKREALFMPPGTIYMYYARGGDSFNISAEGAGNAVLIKSAYPYLAYPDANRATQLMQQLNPVKGSGEIRPKEKLLSGQTLLCRALDIKVPDWNMQQFHRDHFYLADEGVLVNEIIQTQRLGIPVGRDEDLVYRFIDSKFNRFCTKPVAQKLALP